MNLFRTVHTRDKKIHLSLESHLKQSRILLKNYLISGYRSSYQKLLVFKQLNLPMKVVAEVETVNKMVDEYQIRQGEHVLSNTYVRLGTM